MNKILFEDRRFLNKDGYHSTAVCVGLIRQNTGESPWEPLSVEFYMTDCSRQISLDFETSNEEDYQNSLYKLEQIEAVAKGLKEALINNKPIVDKFIENKKKDEHKKNEV